MGSGGFLTQTRPLRPSPFPNYPPPQKMSSSTLFLAPPLQLRSKPNRTSSRALHRPIITASVSEITSPATTPPKLPIRKIPGDYGLPLIGPLQDRYEYFYNQGRDNFFTSRISKHKSTVFRTNMPPGPFISPDCKVVALLDAVSFPTLFDVSKVEKRDLFVGTFMPSTELTGGYRVLSYLDPSEPNHGKLKQLLFFLLKSRRDKVIPEFHNCFRTLFDDLEKEVASQGKADFGGLNDQASFNFLAKSLYGTNPADTELGSDAPGLIQKWVLFQLGPILTIGLPKFVEELVLHTFPLPPFLIKSDYQKLYNFFYTYSTPILEEAVKLGISKEEACNNLLFATCFNSFGGMKFFFPTIMKCIGQAGPTLQLQLAEEIRGVLKSTGGEVTMSALESMLLMKSVVYEALRLEPPVPYQYGKAKKDLIIESHDCAFEVKKGEMLFGFQPFATRDPRIFEKADEFVADRFVGEGEKLLKHVLWSNGPETENPTVDNKQCAGKDFVVLVARLLVVEIFRRYDSFDVAVGSSALGTAVTVCSLKKASF